MIPAIIEIHQKLLQAGLTDGEADDLVTRLMQEEAYEFVDYMREQDKTILN